MDKNKVTYTEEQVDEILRKNLRAAKEGFLKRYNVKDYLELDRLCRVGRQFFDENDSNIEVTEEDLNRILCMDKIKKEIFEYLKASRRSKTEGFGFGKVICFVGSHGVGKTFISKVLAKELYKYSILPFDTVKEIDGYNTNSEDFEDAYKDYEGVLLIKNPEFLFSTFDGDLRISAIEVLKKCSSKYHHKVVTIISCDDAFLRKTIETTPQISPLISQTFYFPNYSIEDLIKLSNFSLNKCGFWMTQEAEDEFVKVLRILTSRKDFAYAATLKNLLNKLFSIQTVRVASEKDNHEINLDDVIKLENDEYICRAIKGNPLNIYEKKLNQLIGLGSVKKEIHRLKAYALKHKSDNAPLNLNFCFMGNPGTGKTEVAKIFAGILYENGLLPKNKLVVKSRADLIGKYVGQTAPLIKLAVEESMGGVLFIDEAYSLFYNSKEQFDYGVEALSELVRLMEENKGKFTVIFAGYKKETLTMIESNPGLRSRITKCIEFKNYEPEELFDIAKLMLFNSKYEMDDELICDLAISVFKNSKNKNYGNARDVRNALESLYQIQAERTIDDFGNMEITKNDLDTYFKEIKYV